VVAVGIFRLPAQHAMQCVANVFLGHGLSRRGADRKQLPQLGQFPKPRRQKSRT
jgi:hypothetical protein